MSAGAGEVGAAVAALEALRAAGRAEGGRTVHAEASGWSAAEHAWHVAAATESVAELLRRRAAGERIPPAGEDHPERREMLARGEFPRGGRTPASMAPPPAFTDDELDARCARAAAALRDAEDAAARIPSEERLAAHVFYGALTAAEWLRFAHVHAAHHLALVRRLPAG